jgi:hypothetical protein
MLENERAPNLGRRLCGDGPLQKAPMKLRLIAALAATLAFVAGAHAETFLGKKREHDFNLQARTLNDLAFPVPTFQPREPGKTLALDLHPTVGAVESGNNGFTWFDACDADIMHDNLAPTRCGRLAVRSDGVVVGAVTFNGGAALPLFIQTSNVHRWGFNTAGHFYPVQDATLQIGSALNRVTDIYLSGIAAPTPGYGEVSVPSSVAQTLNQLKAQVTALSQRMDRNGLTP